MFEFILLAAVMVVIAVVLVAIPLWRGSRGEGPDGQAISIKLYRQRVAELKQDVANGIMPEEDFEQARAELDRQLLDESDGSEPRRRAHRGRWAAGVVILMIPAFGFAVYTQVGGMPWRADKTQAQSQKATSAKVQKMVDGLVQRLKQNPDNGKGWLMLGRSYLVMGEYDKATQALNQARKVLGDTPQTLTDDAEALAMSSSGHSFAGEPKKLLDKALKLDPDFPKALWLSGVAAARTGKEQKAINYWERLLKQQTPGSQTATTLKKTIAQARKRLAQAGGGDSATAAPAVEKNTGATAATGSSIKVRVSLAPDLAGTISPNAAVFIFARPLGGSSIPVAVVRRQVKDLPLSVVLNDHTGMMQGNTLSSYKRVSVDARIAKQGAAMAQPGDLEAHAQTVAVGANGRARLVIDHVLSASGGS